MSSRGGREGHSDGGHQPGLWISYYNQLDEPVLLRPIEPKQYRRPGMSACPAFGGPDDPRLLRRSDRLGASNSRDERPGVTSPRFGVTFWQRDAFDAFDTLQFSKIFPCFAMWKFGVCTPSRST